MLTFSFSFVVGFNVREFGLSSTEQKLAGFDARNTFRYTTGFVLKQEIDHSPPRSLGVERCLTVLLVLTSSVDVGKNVNFLLYTTTLLVVNFYFPSNRPRSVGQLRLASYGLDVVLVDRNGIIVG